MADPALLDRLIAEFADKDDGVNESNRPKYA